MLSAIFRSKLAKNESSDVMSLILLDSLLKIKTLSGRNIQPHISFAFYQSGVHSILQELLERLIRRQVMLYRERNDCQSNLKHHTLLSNAISRTDRKHMEVLRTRIFPRQPSLWMHDIRISPILYRIYSTISGVSDDGPSGRR